MTSPACLASPDGSGMSAGQSALAIPIADVPGAKLLLPTPTTPGTARSRRSSASTTATTAASLA